MKPQKEENRLRFVFYGSLICLSVIQAWFTQLMDDEAYYWVWSLKLDWGYFDHPPMAALLIKCGYLLFHNEFGVRLFSIIIGVVSIYLMEKLIKPSDLKLFYAIVASVAVLHFGCFLAVPDVPLLFSSVLFFHAYKAYIKSQGALQICMVALSVALLIYSKYMGALVIGFTLLSNVRLLKKGSFWLIILLFLALMMPHIMWQYSHDFPSLKYHWVERFTAPYEIADTLNYIIQQPFIFGPFMGVLFMYALFVFKPANVFERALKVNAAGVYLFFLIMTSKGGAEGNWTMVTLVPMLYMGYKLAEQKVKLRKVVMFQLPVAMLLIAGVRVFLVYNFLPQKWTENETFHDNKKWAKQIEQVAGDLPVAFMNSYQNASKYWFYSGHEAFVLNNAQGRKNQFTMWDSENEFQGKKVVVIANYETSYAKQIKSCKGVWTGYTIIDNFRSFGNIKITPDRTYIKLKKGDSVTVKITMCYTNNNQRDFEANKEYAPCISYIILKGANEDIAERIEQKVTNNMIDGRSEYPVTIYAPNAAGKYRVSVCIKVGWLPPGVNDNRIDLEVTE